MLWDTIAPFVIWFVSLPCVILKKLTYYKEFEFSQKLTWKIEKGWITYFYSIKAGLCQWSLCFTILLVVVHLNIGILESFSKSGVNSLISIEDADSHGDNYSFSICLVCSDGHLFTNSSPAVSPAFHSLICCSSARVFNDLDSITKESWCRVAQIFVERQKTVINKSIAWLFAFASVHYITKYLLTITKQISLDQAWIWD